MVVTGIEIYLPLSGMVDMATERARLEKELEEADSHVQRLQKLVDGPFAKKAPFQVVEKEREKLESFRETAEKLRQQIAGLD